MPITDAEALALLSELWWDVFVRVFPTAIACAAVANDDITRMRARKAWERELAEAEAEWG